MAVLVLFSLSVNQKTLAEEIAPDTPNTNAVIQLSPINVIGETSTREPKPGVSTLKGRTLQLQQSDTLGQTLQEELGVSNASFGPGVGTPALRGLTGSRVRILQNGIGTHDATSLSPDHALAIDTLFANEIKVLRGPEIIRYGGNAIGGVVDVSDGRIPERRAKKPISGVVESRYNTNGNGTHSAFKLNTGKDQFAFNLGGSFRDRNDIRIPGKAIDEQFVAEQFGLSNITNVSGKIPNTDSRAIGGFVGLSWLGEQFMAGMSVSHSDKRYGIPRGSHHLDSNHLDGLETILPRLENIEGFEDIFGPQALFPNVRIKMNQTRYDFKSQWYEPIQGIDSIDFQYGLVDYAHTEFEGGEPFTRFKNDAGEGRVEMHHSLLPNFTGIFGVQWIDRDFSAIGAETFIPKTKQLSLGFYTAQKYVWNNWTLQGGLRFENAWINPAANELRLRGSALPPVSLPGSLDYQAISGSASIEWRPQKNTAVTLTYNHAERPPDIQELLSLGPHLSTRSFDVGNVQLKNETMDMVDLGFEWKTDRLSVQAHGYYNHASDFIYRRNTGLVYEVDNEVIRQRCVSAAECVSILAYSQRSAAFYGYESKVDATLFKWPAGKLSLSLFSDYVRGRFNKGDRADVPRMPPLRFGSELGLSNETWHTALRYTRATPQHNPGENEFPTAGYHLLTATADYQLEANQWLNLWFFAKGYNLLNEEIRSSVSFLRSFAPEPGRSFIFGIRATL